MLLGLFPSVEGRRCPRGQPVYIGVLPYNASPFLGILRQRRYISKACGKVCHYDWNTRDTTVSSD